MKPSDLNRRQFLKIGMKSGLLVTGVSAGVIQPLFTSTAHAAPADNGLRADVYIAESTDHAAAVIKAVEMAGGISRYVKPGQRVILKPNMAWSRKPEHAANTNPVVMATLTELCFNAGAKEVLVTDNPCNQAKTVYAMSGIAKACGEKGAKVFYARSQHYKKQNVGGKFVKTQKVLMPFVEADVVINVPVAKHHGSSRVSIGMKNWFGAVGGFRGMLHQNLDQAIADLAGYFKPALTVVDCTRILMDGGPTGGNVQDVKLQNRVLTSTDQVAVDTVACEYLEADPNQIDFIKIAHDKKIGTMKAEHIKQHLATV